MKKLLLAVVALCVLTLFVAVPAGPPATPRAWGVIYVTNASTTVPTNFVAGVSATTNIYASRITILGKPSPRGANTSTAYIGTTAGDSTQPYPVTSGGEVLIVAPEGSVFNLRDWYVDVGTANDGLTIIYQ
jgi:hypothetical protein